MEFHVKVIPNAKQDIIEQGLDGNFRIHVKAPPRQGKANAALIRLLAKHFKTSESKIRIIRGRTSRNKIISIDK